MAAAHRAGGVGCDEGERDDLERASDGDADRDEKHDKDGAPKGPRRDFPAWSCDGAPRGSLPSGASMALRRHAGRLRLKAATENGTIATSNKTRFISEGSSDFTTRKVTAPITHTEAYQWMNFGSF